MRFTSLAAAILLTFAAGAASATDDKSSDKGGLQCHSETVVGSHLPKRVCTTAAEREALRKASQDKVGNLKMQGRGVAVRTGGSMH